MRSLHPRPLSRITLIIIVGLICFYGQNLQAESWKCGTPLICEKFHTFQNNVIPNVDNIMAAPAAPAKIGQSFRFFVHIPETTINAKCVAVGKYCYIFVEEIYQEMLTEAQGKAIANTFDTEIYPNVHHWIGSETQPGLDRDNKITILLHDVGNNESGQDFGGYFSPTDLYPTLPTSNRRDILYMDIFQYKIRSELTFKSSLAHEFAHLINWYQNGGTSDQRWLEEGIASFTEWGIYRYIHTLFVDGYLADPSMSLTTANTFDTYYGASFMFLLYLYENHGGINFIRKLADEDILGLPAIDATLNKNENLVDVFLNWATANWFNNPVRGNELNYQNLPNRRITAHIPRINQYPTTSGITQIDSWGVKYFLFQNLPTNFVLTLNSSPDSYLYANIAYYNPDKNRPIIKSVPSILDVNGEDSKRTNRIQIGNLRHDGKILLIVTSEYPQTFKYDAKQADGLNSIDIVNLIQTHKRDYHHSIESLTPSDVTYPPASNTKPIYINRNAGIPIIPTHHSIKLNPVSQIHLSSNYNKIIIKNNIAYTTSDWGLEIFSLTPTPIHIGESATPGLAQAIAVDEDTVYVADGKSGVLMIDVNPPTSPKIIKSLGGFQNARDVHFANQKLYTLDTLNGLLIFNKQDLNNHNNPLPRQSFRTDGSPIKVSTNDEGKIYLSDNARGLYILTPDNLGGFTISNTLPLLISDFHVLGRFVLAAAGDLQVVNIGNIFRTEVISRANTPGSLTSVNFFQGLLYLTDKQSGLHVVSVNNTQTPRVISSHPTLGNASDIALQYYEDDKKIYAYVADGHGGIQTIDVTHPNSPIWVNNYSSKGVAHAIDAKYDGVGTTVAIANGRGGVKIVELDDTQTGKIVRVIRTVSGEQGALCVKVHKHNVFVGTDNGMTVIDIETGKMLAHIATTEPVWDIALIHNYAYLCAKSLIIVDITIPEQSRIVTQRTFPGSAYRITDDGSNVYVAALEGGVHLFDISEPAQPRPISTYTTEGTAANVMVDNNYLYILDNRHGVLQIDKQKPNQLTLISNYVDTQLPIAAEVNGNYLFLLDIDTLQIIDTRTMTRLTRYSQFQSPTDILAVDDVLYVTDKHQLKIFRINTENQNLAVEENPQNYSEQITQKSLTPKNQLLQNFPNPFNPETWIPFTLAKPSEVSLTIYNTSGKLIIQKTLGFHQSGRHRTHWDGKNMMGEPVVSGTYFYKLNAGDFSHTRKMVIQR